MAAGPAQRLGLSGRLVWEVFEPLPGDFAIGSSGVAAVDTHLAGLPRQEDAESLARVWATRRPARVVVRGAGYAFDVARRAMDVLGEPLSLVFVPAGAEPWRAFAPFGSLYELDGERRSGAWSVRTDPLIVLDEALWASVPAAARQLHRVDSAVHAIEVLISAAATPWSRELATGALRLLSRDADGGLASVAASGMAVHAFASTGLGAAHALASPLGLLHHRTHDQPNAILGAAMVRWWGGAVDWHPVTEVIGGAPTAESVAGWLEDLPGRTGSPYRLSDAGFDPGTETEVLDRAVRSSGVPWFPQPRGRERLAELLAAVW